MARWGDCASRFSVAPCGEEAMIDKLHINQRGDGLFFLFFQLWSVYAWLIGCTRSAKCLNRCVVMSRKVTTGVRNSSPHLVVDAMREFVGIKVAQQR